MTWLLIVHHTILALKKSQVSKARYSGSLFKITIFYYKIWFSAKYASSELYFGLGSSLNGTITTKLIAGAVYNSYQMTIIVQIYDNDTAFAYYVIPKPVIVLIYLQNMTSQLFSKETELILSEGSYLTSIQEIQALASLLNEQSLQDKYGLVLNGIGPVFPQIFGPLFNYSGVLPVITK